MQHHEIAERFNRVYNGEKNFMTPNIVRYGQKGAFLYELSNGRGFGDQLIYGVTVITMDGKKCHSLSDCHQSMAEAEKAIKNLKGATCEESA